MISYFIKKINLLTFSRSNSNICKKNLNTLVNPKKTSNVFGGTTILTTNNGFKPIKHICLKDKLMTKAGNFINIQSVKKLDNNKETIVLKVKYHPQPILCGKDQLFLTRSKCKNKFLTAEYKQADLITKNDYVGTPINLKADTVSFKVKNNLSKKETSINLNSVNQWWVLGYFVGDGWLGTTNLQIKNNDNRIFFSINKDQISEIIPKISKVLPICDFGDYSGNSTRYRCNNKLWYSILSDFGRYSHDKRIPAWVFDAPNECIKAFIDGYRRADGDFTKEGFWRLTTVSPSLAYGTQLLYLKLGLIFSLTADYKRAEKTIILGRTVNQRVPYTLKGLDIPTRKQAAFIEDGYVWYKISSCNIEENSNVEFFEIRTETNEPFLVENLITKSY